MIHVVDYGLGNVQAFLTLYKRLGFEATRAKTAADLAGASKIILPGVGAFDHAIELLDQSGMRPTLETLVLQDKVPVLGICVGMQILASASDEGRLPGLGWVPGKVCAFRANEQSASLPLPHMGWNDVSPRDDRCLFKGMAAPRFYFLHSYYFAPDNASDVLGVTDYNGSFASAARSGNVFGTQFHPEKSHQWGTAVLKNFAEL